MDRRTLRTLRWPTLLLAGTLLTAAGCSRDQERSASAPGSPSKQVQAQEESGTIELGKLPRIEPAEASRVSLQRLEKVTELEENVAVHVKLPPPANEQLKESLVRVLGDAESPVVMFKSDALAELGAIPSSPGPEFFTQFSQFDEREIARRIENEHLLESGELGRITREHAVFDGRMPVAITEGIAFNHELFDKFLPINFFTCPAVPASTTQGWGESLFITSPSVVLNPARTWDPCTGAGTQGGKWTFAHLIRQMAVGSGYTAEDFVFQWLKQWLADYTVNGDVVPGRGFAMFNQVIQPWANASGASVSLINLGGGQFDATIIGSLNLDKAPFRLLAIVNRIDMGATTTGGGGYGGGTAARPVEAGELRFIFGVVEPNPWGAGGSQATCGLKPFTVIFEYGVPITGCGNIVQYAKKWTELNTVGGFNATYMAKLEAITQSVVMAGAAPLKGNGNALNQIRTNENALDFTWELREFKLADEDPITGVDTPSNGLLRAHTVAQTPDDGTYPAFGDPTIDNYVLNVVGLGLPTPVGPLPSKCSSPHSVPYKVSGMGFRGGNSLVGPPHWQAVSANSANPVDVCARFQFSLNTCGGCHKGDTATNFTHVSTSGIPVSLSNFLTGGGPGLVHTVPDQQFSSPNWQFADLERRWKRLYDISFCVSCSKFGILSPAFVDRIKEINGAVPIDPIEKPEKLPFEIGPITDIERVKQIFESRREFITDAREEPVDFIRPVAPFVH